MPIHKLTPRKVATVGPGRHEDGGGLRLVVSRTDARKWRLRFTLHGKHREMWAWITCSYRNGPKGPFFRLASGRSRQNERGQGGG